MIETAIWWTGACVLSAGAALAAAAVFAALVAGTIAVVSYYGQRASNLVSNIHFMHQWRRAGCPRWYHEDGGLVQMKPAKGKL